MPDAKSGLPTGFAATAISQSLQPQSQSAANNLITEPSISPRLSPIPQTQAEIDSTIDEIFEEEEACEVCTLLRI